MIESFNIQALVDVIFAVVVVAACYTTLAQSSRTNDKKNEKWRLELIELHSALKELIEKASVASNNLDRRLIKRKEELESLLSKIENKQKILKNEELPNQTWTKNNKSDGNQTIELNETVLVNQEDENDEVGQDEKLDRFISFTKSINQEIEKTDDTALDSSAYNFANQVDPTTYKIAKRLIAEGHEIHVIARKLEMPVAQVRLLDKIIRNSKETTYAPGKGAVEKRTKHGNYIRQVVNGDY